MRIYVLEARNCGLICCARAFEAKPDMLTCAEKLFGKDIANAVKNDGAYEDDSGFEVVVLHLDLKRGKSSTKINER